MNLKKMNKCLVKNREKILYILVIIIIASLVYNLFINKKSKEGFKEGNKESIIQGSLLTEEQKKDKTYYSNLKKFIKEVGHDKFKKHMVELAKSQLTEEQLNVENYINEIINDMNNSDEKKYNISYIFEHIAFLNDNKSSNMNHSKQIVYSLFYPLILKELGYDIISIFNTVLMEKNNSNKVFCTDEENSRLLCHPYFI